MESSQKEDSADVTQNPEIESLETLPNKNMKNGRHDQTPRSVQNRIVASIKELNTNNMDIMARITNLEKKNEELKQLVNANGTNIIIEQA